MKKKYVAICGSVLSLGSAGYYIYRSYARSDHSLKGALRQCGRDIQQDLRRMSDGGHRAGVMISSAVGKINGKISTLRSKRRSRRLEVPEFERDSGRRQRQEAPWKEAEASTEAH